MGRDKVNVHFVGFDVHFHHFLNIVVCYVEGGLVLLCGLQGW
jgi:hypothetical protein